MTRGEIKNYVKYIVGMVITLSAFVIALDQLNVRFFGKTDPCIEYRNQFDEYNEVLTAFQESIEYPNTESNVLDANKYFKEDLDQAIESALGCRDSTEVRQLINKSMDISRDRMERYIQDWQQDRASRNFSNNDLDVEAKSFIYQVVRVCDMICENQLCCDKQVAESFRRVLKRYDNE